MNKRTVVIGFVGTKLDSVLLTDDATFVPTGTGGTP